MSKVPREHKFINGIDHALCSTCKKFYPMHLFYKKSSTLDGHTSQCKYCIKEYEQKNLQRIGEYQKRYRKEHKTDIYLNCIRWQNAQGEEYKEKRRRYWEKYRKEHKEAYKAWYEEHFSKSLSKEKYRFNTRKRRARMRNVEVNFSEIDWRECLEFFNYKDAYTGLDMVVISMDHVIPISRGGKHTRNNIVPCENSINKQKGHSMLEKWYREQPFFSEERLKKIYEWIE